MKMSNEKPRRPILSGLRVLDIGHQYAAANCCSILADLGADVLQVEHPTGGPIRNMLPKKGAHSLWWKVVERGKKHITLNLSKPRGREMLLKIAKDYDVLVENFRPGTLEKWRLGPADLEAAGLNLTMVRISGFGQTGPYSPQPGYGSAAEAMSGFAHMNGYPDGPPMFPSSTLADGVASLWGVIGTLASLYGNRRTPRRRGSRGRRAFRRAVPYRPDADSHLSANRRRADAARQLSRRSRHASQRLRDARRPLVHRRRHRGTIRNILVGAGANELIEVLDTGLLSGNDRSRSRPSCGAATSI